MKEISCGDIIFIRYLGYRKKKDEGFFFLKKKDVYFYLFKLF